jgi:hypothetical protein
MRTFHLEQSDKEITSHAGMALIGAAITNHTSLAQAVDAALPKRHGTPSSDLVKIYLGLLAQGKSDFEAINSVRGDGFFLQALDLNKGVPTETSVRTRFEEEADVLTPLINRVNVEFLVNREVPITPLRTGHVPLDIDVTPHDNSNSKKENVSRTYKGKDGYAPIACYLGQEGWCIRDELREGKQHSQCDFIPTLERTFSAVHQVMEKQPIERQAIMVRLDSGHDAKDTRAWLYDVETPLLVDFIIKWNPRKEASIDNKEKWLEYAQQLGCLAHWDSPREGKLVATFSVYVDEEREGKTYTTRRVMQLTKRTIDKHGQLLLTPELEIEGWWTTLDFSDQEILALYRDHATSEQFHSEIKTDLDLEKLPSGKFASNTLILTMGLFTYNVLRWIGLAGLMGDDSPVRHQAKRRRVRTVMQELIYLAAHIHERGRRLIMRFGRTSPGYQAFQRVYQQLCFG